MKEFSIPMALVDLIPVLLFFLATWQVGEDLKKRMNAVCAVLFRGGSLVVVAAGLLKALYKLLYAAGVGDFEWMSRQFFSNQAFGFLLAGLGLTLFVLKPKKNTTYALLPTMALVGIMVIGVGAMDASLCYLASKMKKHGALVMFILSFFLILGMGYLSSKSFDKAFMNWVAEGVNIAGQLLLFLGCRQLHRAGLAQFEG